MKFFLKFFPSILWLVCASFLNAQTAVSVQDPQLVGTNALMNLSYSQQVREVQSDATERVLSEGMALRKQAQERDRKEREEKEELMRLQQQEIEMQQRKQELEEEEIRKELKEQLLIKYVRKLQQENLTNSATTQQRQKPKDSALKSEGGSDQNQTLIPERQSNSPQEALGQ